VLIRQTSLNKTDSQSTLNELKDEDEDGDINDEYAVEMKLNFDIDETEQFQKILQTKEDTECKKELNDYHQDSIDNSNLDSFKNKDEESPTKVHALTHFVHSNTIISHIEYVHQNKGDHICENENTESSIDFANQKGNKIIFEKEEEDTHPSSNGKKIPEKIRTITFNIDEMRKKFTYSKTVVRSISQVIKPNLIYFIILYNICMS